MENTIDNTSLINGLREGNTRSMSDLFDEYYSALCYFAEGIIHNKEEAKDITVVAFNKLWERRENFESIAAVKSFLYMVTRNACYDFLRHNKYITNYREEFIATSDDDEADRLETESELLRKIYQEVAKLPPKCREVFELTHFEGLHIAQIAERLHTTVTNVTSQRSRAIQLLKIALTDKELVFLYAMMAEIYCRN